MVIEQPGTPRPIRVLGDPVLRTPCDPVTSFDEALARLINDMFATMNELGGAGLAANQIGVPLRVFVYSCPDDAGNYERGYVVNPILVMVDEGPVEEAEGCLSIPGLSFDTKRYAHAVVEGVDLNRDPVKVEGHGLLARCLQHEMNHLDGTLFVDQLQGAQRRQAMRILREVDWSRPYADLWSDPFGRENGGGGNSFWSYTVRRGRR